MRWCEKDPLFTWNMSQLTQRRRALIPSPLSRRGPCSGADIKARNIKAAQPVISCSVVSYLNDALGLPSH